MKISIIGSGRVGGTLGQIWAGQGHEIMFGSRNPEEDKVQELLGNIGNGSTAGSISDAVDFGEIIVFATPWHATQEICESIGEQASRKIIIDCTNALLPNMSGLAIESNTSAAEQIAGWIPGTKVVKTFNTTGAGNYLNPTFGSENMSMFICGDDEEAKNIVSDLAVQMGFDVVDTGNLMMARVIEQLALLWISLAYGRQMGPNIGFKLLRR